jgi:chromosome segregation ATPase
MNEEQILELIESSVVRIKELEDSLDRASRELASANNRISYLTQDNKDLKEQLAEATR